MWEVTKTLRDGMEKANGVPIDRFPPFLDRLASKLIQNEQPFTDAEEVKLVKVMGLSKDDLITLIDACTFTLEKAATQSASISQLKDFLLEAGVLAAPIAVFQDVWKARGQALISTLKEKPFGAPGDSQLIDVQWRVHMQVYEGPTQLFEPVGILQLSLGSFETRDSVNNNIALEFSHEDLCKLFDTFDHIQSELDSLT